MTDPPYYDNISYADLSDFFYVWLKRSVGFLYETDLGGELTPKKNEAVVAPYRHDGDGDAAREHYEALMAQSFAEAHRVLKPDAPLVCVYSAQDRDGLGQSRGRVAPRRLHDYRGVADRHGDG